jgi:prepilin-type N-terminal cleavage/methylation domain-containing protein
MHYAIGFMLTAAGYYFYANCKMYRKASQMFKRSDHQGGYTLLELIVVLVAICILIALLIWR